MPRVRDLTDELRTEIAGFQVLHDLLRAEQEALRVADADALSQLASAKLKQVNMLQNLALARSQALADSGLPETAAGIAAWLAWSADPQCARELWAALLAIAAETRTTNALNGRLALAQQRHYDRAVDALWRAAGHAALYGADGRPQHGATTRTLAAI